MGQHVSRNQMGILASVLQVSKESIAKTVS